MTKFADPSAVPLLSKRLVKSWTGDDSEDTKSEPNIRRQLQSEGDGGPDALEHRAYYDPPPNDHYMVDQSPWPGSEACLAAQRRFPVPRIDKK